MFKFSYAVISSSKSKLWVICSSASTKSSSRITPGCSLKPVFLTAKRLSIEYWAFWLISASWSKVLNLSKIAFAPAGVSYESSCPASTMKSHAISTEAYVGWFSKMKSNCKPAYSPKTLWLIKCAIIFVVAIQTILLFLSKALLNWIITLLRIKFAISGNLVLMTEINAAYTWVKFGEAIWALINDFERMPFPLRMF